MIATWIVRAFERIPREDSRARGSRAEAANDVAPKLGPPKSFFAPAPNEPCNGICEVSPNHQIPVTYREQPPSWPQITLEMSLVAPALPFKAATPARIVSASRQCQRRSISFKAQPNRSSLPPWRQQQPASQTRVGLICIESGLNGTILTSPSAIPCFVPCPCRLRPLCRPRRK
jgi:hypothetical protein